MELKSLGGPDVAALAPLISVMLRPALLLGLDLCIRQANGPASAYLAGAAEVSLVPVVGASIGGFCSGEEHKNLRMFLTHVLEHPDDPVCTHITLAGVTGPVRFHGAAIRDAKGTFVAVLLQADPPSDAVPTDFLSVVRAEPDGPGPAAGVTPDLTDQQKLAMFGALAGRELRWKTAVLSADLGVWDHDISRGTRYLSSGWRKIRGIAEDAEVADDYSDWLMSLHPDDRPHVLAEISRGNFGETDIINYAYRQRHRDGHWMWLWSRGRIVRRSADGSPEHIIGIDTDITALKEAERQWREAAERLAVAEQAANLGRWEYESETRRFVFNDRLKQLLGLTGTPGPQVSAAMIHPKDLARTRATFLDCVRRRADCAMAFRVLRADGAVVYLRAYGRFLPRAGRCGAYLGVVIDATADNLRQQALEAAHARQRHDAMHDALTGLLNRRSLDDWRAGLPAVAPAGAGGFALLSIDLDRFKQINDLLGHAAGDAALRHAAAILRAMAPPAAQVYRIGGDEFLIVVPDPPPAVDLQRLATDLIARLSEPMRYKDETCRFSASVGIATCAGSWPAVEACFVQSDQALYHSKVAGRGRAHLLERLLPHTPEPRFSPENQE